MKMNILHKMKELDAEAWEISCKKKALTNENEELDSQLVALQAKLQWRKEHIQELYCLYHDDSGFFNALFFIIVHARGGFFIIILTGGVFYALF